MQTRVWFDFPSAAQRQSHRQNGVPEVTGRRGDAGKGVRGVEVRRTRSLSSRIENSRRNEIAVLDYPERDRSPQASGPSWAFRGTAPRRSSLWPRRNIAAPLWSTCSGGNSERPVSSGSIVRAIRSASSSKAVEWNRCFGDERTDARARQLGDMSVAAERAAEVARDRAHVSALAAFGLKYGRSRPRPTSRSSRKMRIGRDAISKCSPSRARS